MAGPRSTCLASAAASADKAVPPAAERPSATQNPPSAITSPGADSADLIAVSRAITRETAIKSSATPDMQPEQVAPVTAATSESARPAPPSLETAEPADLFPFSAAIATENGNKAPTPGYLISR